MSTPIQALSTPQSALIHLPLSGQAINIQLSLYTHCIVAHCVSTSSPDIQSLIAAQQAVSLADSSQSHSDPQFPPVPQIHNGPLPPLGSFIYALPPRTGNEVLSTTLASHASTAEFTTRTAKILARKLSIPIYLSCKVEFGALGQVNVDEEVEATRAIVQYVSDAFKTSRGGDVLVNGTDR